MPLSEEDKRKRAQAADSINAILSQSSIKTASENAFQRAKAQEARKLQATRLSADDAQLAMALGVKQREGAKDRQNMSRPAA